jgi:hypothetical protein
MADLMGDFEQFAANFRTLVAHYKKQFPTVEIDENSELNKLKVSLFLLI